MRWYEFSENRARDSLHGLYGCNNEKGLENVNNKTDVSKVTDVSMVGTKRERRYNRYNVVRCEVRMRFYRCLSNLT